MSNIKPEGSIFCEIRLYARLIFKLDRRIGTDIRVVSYIIEFLMQFIRGLKILKQL